MKLLPLPPWLIAMLAAGSLLSQAAADAAADEIDVCIERSEGGLALKRAGKLLDARALLATCAVAACPTAVETVCRERLSHVVSAIPSIIFAVKTRSGRDISDVKLMIDGAEAANHRAGTPVVLDPGDHEFVFEVAGEKPVALHFVLTEGEQGRHEEILVGSPPPPVVAPMPPAPPPPPSPTNHRVKIAIALGAAGVAGLGVGAVTGGMAISKSASAKANCPFDGTMLRCPQSAVDEMNAAKRLATASDVAFGVGVAGVAAGITLLIVKPHESKQAADVAWSSASSWFWGVMPTAHRTDVSVGHAF